jgi:signal peptidase I
VNPPNPPTDGESRAQDEFDWDLSVFAAPSETVDAVEAEAPAAAGDGVDTGEIEITLKKQPKKSLPFWLELPLLVGIALIVAVVIKTFFFQAFYIPSGSMKETLQIEDRVLVNKIALNVNNLEIGDVIVFDDPRSGFEAPAEGVVESALRNVAESIGLATPQSEFIKRIVGLPGDEVELVSNQLLINGVEIDEPYLAESARPPSTCGDANYGPITVPEGHVLVMGDNRCHSSDGRSFGPIPTNEIVGKAFVVIWPPSRWGGL